MSKRTKLHLTKRERKHFEIISQHLAPPSSSAVRAISIGSNPPPNIALPINLFVLPEKDEGLFPVRRIEKPIGSNKDGYRVSASPDQSKFAIGCYTGEVLFYHVRNDSRHISRFESRQTNFFYPGPKSRNDNPVTAVEFAPDGSFLVVGWERGYAVAFNAETGEVTFELNTSTDSSITTLCISNDCERLVIGGHQGMKSFNMASNISDADEVPFLNDRNYIESICFSPDDTKLSVGCQDGCFIYDR